MYSLFKPVVLINGVAPKFAGRAGEMQPLQDMLAVFLTTRKTSH
jgi:hypothetical protein